MTSRGRRAALQVRNTENRSDASVLKRRCFHESCTCNEIDAIGYRGGLQGGRTDVTKALLRVTRCSQAGHESKLCERTKLESIFPSFSARGDEKVGSLSIKPYIPVIFAITVCQTGFRRIAIRARIWDRILFPLSRGSQNCNQKLRPKVAIYRIIVIISLLQRTCHT